MEELHNDNAGNGESGDLDRGNIQNHSTDGTDTPGSGQLLSQPEGEPSEPQEKADSGSLLTGRLLLVAIFGLAIILILTLAGKFDPFFQGQVVKIPDLATATRRPLPTFASNNYVTQAATNKPPEATLTPDPTRAYHRRLEQAQIDLSMAKNHMLHARYPEAISYWDDVIRIVPEYQEAYYQRSRCYWQMAQTERDQNKFRKELEQALDNLNQALKIGPQKGDDFLYRYQIYDQLAGLEPLRADRNSIEAQALENLQKAVSQGNSDPYSNRLIPLTLFSLGRCEEGMSRLQAIGDAQPTGESPDGGLLNIQAYGYLCLGETKQALESIESSLAAGSNPQRKWLRAVILYQMGKADEAFTQLDDLIQPAADDAGLYYYLRALINYEKGKIDQAKEDLANGSTRTWFQGGLKAYVEGRLALDAGKRAEGIQYLHDAQNTLEWYFNIFQTRLEKELVSIR